MVRSFRFHYQHIQDTYKVAASGSCKYLQRIRSLAITGSQLHMFIVASVVTGETNSQMFSCELKQYICLYDIHRTVKDVLFAKQLIVGLSDLNQQLWSHVERWTILSKVENPINLFWRGITSTDPKHWASLHSPLRPSGCTQTLWGTNIFSSKIIKDLAFSSARCSASTCWTQLPSCQHFFLFGTNHQAISNQPIQWFFSPRMHQTQSQEPGGCRVALPSS